MRCLLCALALLFAVQLSHGATVYVRDGGSGNGSSWSNALDDLPVTMSSSNTYYVAAGNYSSADIAGTVLRATVDEHGSDVGWSDSYDGQATFNAVISLVADNAIFDGVTWEGFVVLPDNVGGPCPSCGTITMTGDDTTLRGVSSRGTYGASWGHSVGVSGRNATVDYVHIYKALYEDSFGGEPKGTFTIKNSVITLPNPPDDGEHRDIFNPYTQSTGYSIVLENNIINDIWLIGFLMQDPARITSVIMRGNVFANGGAWVIWVVDEAGVQGVETIIQEWNTFYNIIDYLGSGPVGSLTQRNNIYAKSSGWADSWGGTTVHTSGAATNSLFWTDPTDFVDVTDPLGPDGIPNTDDDGFRLKANSEAIGAASDGTDVGAYQYAAVGTAAPKPVSAFSIAGVE